MEDKNQYDKIIDAIIPQLMDRLSVTPTFFGGSDRVQLGDKVVLVNTLFNTVSGHIVVEDFVFFGHNVSVLTGTHCVQKFDEERQIAIPKSGRDIVIERGAWIASNTTIIGPCRIGRDAVIAAGSVVSGDVKSGWIYAGVPARPVKPIGKSQRREILSQRIKISVAKIKRLFGSNKN